MNWAEFKRQAEAASVTLHDKPDLFARLRARHERLHDLAMFPPPQVETPPSPPPPVMREPAA